MGLGMHKLQFFIWMWGYWATRLIWSHRNLLRNFDPVDNSITGIGCVQSHNFLGWVGCQWSFEVVCQDWDDAHEFLQFMPCTLISEAFLNFLLNLLLLVLHFHTSKMKENWRCKLLNVDMFCDRLVTSFEAVKLLRQRRCYSAHLSILPMEWH